MLRIIKVLVLMILLFTKSFSFFSFVVYGDTRFHRDRIRKKLVYQTINYIDALATEAWDSRAALVLHIGDFWDDYYHKKVEKTDRKYFYGVIKGCGDNADSTDKYGGKNKTVVNMNIRGLIEQNNFLGIQGNHETEASVKAFQEKYGFFLREDEGDISTCYSFLKEDCFFVCLGRKYTQSYKTYSYIKPEDFTWIRNQFDKEEAKNAKWKFLLLHFPIFQNGKFSEHLQLDNNQSKEIQNICDEYGVDICFTAHIHIFERTYPLYNGKIIPQENPKWFIKKDNKGTIYVVTGLASSAPELPYWIDFLLLLKPDFFPHEFTAKDKDNIPIFYSSYTETIFCKVVVMPDAIVCHSYKVWMEDPSGNPDKENLRSEWYDSFSIYKTDPTSIHTLKLIEQDKY